MYCRKPAPMVATMPSSFSGLQTIEFMPSFKTRTITLVQTEIGKHAHEFLLLRAIFPYPLRPRNRRSPPRLVCRFGAEGFRRYRFVMSVVVGRNGVAA